MIVWMESFVDIWNIVDIEIIAAMENIVAMGNTYLILFADCATNYVQTTRVDVFTWCL